MHFPERGTRQHLQLHRQNFGTAKKMLMFAGVIRETRMLERLSIESYIMSFIFVEKLKQ